MTRPAGADPHSSAEVDRFRTLVTPALVSMARLADRLTSPIEQDAVVQAALATAWRRRSGYDASRAPVQTWLLAIVAETTWGGSSAGGDGPTELIDLPSPMPARDPSRDLDDAIAELPREERLAVELGYLLGLEIADCAAVMACTPSAASATLEAARGRLRTSATGAQRRLPDGELEDRLRERGDVYRGAHRQPPVVDWTKVAAPRRRRALAAVVAAVVVVLAAAALVVHLDSAAGPSRRAASPRVTPMAPGPDALRGAPRRLFGLRDGDLLQQDGTASARYHLRGQPFEALAVPGDGGAALVAIGIAQCRTSIDSEAITLESGTRSIPTLRIAGRVGDVPMAVSPNGQRLALVVQPRVRSAGGGRAGCDGREVIEVVDPNDGRVVGSYPMPLLADADSLQWSPNNVTLAFRLIPKCVSCQVPSPGTHLLDTSVPTTSATSTKPLLPLIADGVPYGPVFWWHGQLVTAYEGGLWSLNGHGVDRVVASDLPRTGVVDTVSSDPTGNHLLLTSNRSAYRWDNGLRSKLPGAWDQIAW
jgi:RNA polymerase sigma-70 factor (ECF subfamily)